MEINQVSNKKSCYIWQKLFMKKVIIGASILLVSSISPLQAEDSKNYITIGGGIAFPIDSEGDTKLGAYDYDFKYELDDAGLFSIGFGRKFNDYRLEFNYSKATIESDSFSVTSGGSGIVASITPALESDVSSYMVYGYKDFPSDSKFTPYAGLGLGIGNFSAKNQTATITGTAYKFEGGNEAVFSLGLKGGVSYELAENTSLFTEGLYQNFASYQVAETGYETVNYDSNQFFAVSAGIKYSF